MQETWVPTLTREDPTCRGATKPVHQDCVATTTSSAGHIPAGDEPLESALRELGEELGIHARPEQLHYAGTFDIRYEKEFHDRLFRDNELSHVYVYMEPVEVSDLTLQAEEVSRVDWFDLEDTWAALPTRRDVFCIPTQGMAVLREYLSFRG